MRRSWLKVILTLANCCCVLSNTGFAPQAYVQTLRFYSLFVLLWVLTAVVHKLLVNTQRLGNVEKARQVSMNAFTTLHTIPGRVENSMSLRTIPQHLPP